MKRLVIKFGGTSLMDAERIAHAAKLTAAVASEGYQLAVVVSAMGHSTDHLIKLANGLNSAPDARELDQLMATGEQMSAPLMALALQSLGLKAQSFTGEQAGIVTDRTYGSANIKTIRAGAVDKCLRNGVIPVIAGFQGISENGDITTLGRGGSDTTAIAMAAALHAERCDIYTDVNGVYTADPRLCPDSRRIEQIGYVEMHELALNGVQVLNARSVATAMHNHIQVRVRSTFEPSDKGSLVTRVDKPQPGISGIGCDLNKDCVIVGFAAPNRKHKTTLRALRYHRFLIKRSLMDLLRNTGIQAELVSTLKDSSHRFSLSVQRDQVESLRSILQTAGFTIYGRAVEGQEPLAKISIVSQQLQPAVDMDVILTLAKANIPVALISRKQHSFSVFLPESQKETAIRALHNQFFAAPVEAQLSRLA
jgi:aspartate kinase